MFTKDGAKAEVTQELSSPPKPGSGGTVPIQDCPLHPKALPVPRERLQQSSVPLSDGCPAISSTA